MDVAVDEPGQEAQTVEAEHGARGGPGRSDDVGHLPACHDDRAALLRRRAGPVNQCRARQDQPVFHELPVGIAAPGGAARHAARVRRATASMCGVWGNMSTGWTHSRR